MASKNISFDTIPSGIRKPGQYMEFNTKLAVRTLPTNSQTVLIVGQRLAGGSVPPNTPTLVFSGDEASKYFGDGSLAHLAAVAAMTANPNVSLTVIAVDDAAAAQPATGKVTFTGPATGDGAFALYIGKARVDIAINTDDTADAIAARLVAQIGQTTALPVTAAAAAGVVTLTAKNKGEAGNGIILAQLNQTAGVTAALEQFTGGLNDPDITTALATVFGATYNLYVSSWIGQSVLTKLRTHVNTISNAVEKRSAVAVAGFPGTLAAGSTLAGALNAGRITMAWYPGSTSLPAEIAASYAAVIASENDPARPLNTLPLTGLDVTPVASRAGRTEQENALHNGLTPIEVGPGDVPQIVRAITTYLVDPQGVPDESMLDLTTIRIMDYGRKAWQQRVALRFPREKLSEKTPPKVRSELLDVAYKMEDLEIIENVDKWKDKLICERDEQDVNQLDAAIPCDAVNGLHVFAARIDLIL